MKRFESGQISLLLAFAMIGLLAIFGLAIDGSRLYWLQRDAQNAVDAAAISGTLAACEGRSIDAAAHELLRLNGFDVNEGVGEDENLHHEVVINTWHELLDNRTYVQVILTAQMRPSIGQLFYGGEWAVTVKASGKCYNAPIPANTLLTAVSQVCQDALSIHGSYNHIEGGAYSGTDTNISSSDSTIDGYLQSVGTTQINPWVGLNPVDYNPVQVSPMRANPPFVWSQFVPGSGEYALKAEAEGMLHYYPGDMRVVGNANGDPVILEPGLYVVEGNVDMRNSNWEVSGSGQITIVARGRINISADTINLTGYVGDWEYGKLLLYSDQGTNCGNDAINLSSSTVNWDGAVVAPYGNVSFSNSTNTGIGPIYGQQINISGSNLTIRDSREFHTRAKAIILAE